MGGFLWHRKTESLIGLCQIYLTLDILCDTYNKIRWNFTLSGLILSPTDQTPDLAALLMIKCTGVMEFSDG